MRARGESGINYTAAEGANGLRESLRQNDSCLTQLWKELVIRDTQGATF